MNTRLLRPIIASLLVSAGWVLPGAADAVLPTPGCGGNNTLGVGFAYVGTANPTTVPRTALPPVDLGPVSITATDVPGGAKQVEVHGGQGDVVHFGAGLSQLFTGVASLSGFVYAEIGSIHLAASGSAETLPLEYNTFPGALGENPFYAQVSVSMQGCCEDVVEIPATQQASMPGQLTTVTLSVGYSGHETEGADYEDDLHGFRPSADLSLADGTDLGGVISGTRVLASVPVLTPLVLTFCFSGGITATAGHDLVGVIVQGDINTHGGDIGSDHAFFNGLNTAEVSLVNADKVGATGATGHHYDTFSGGSTITTTTTTTTTSLFVPPATLPSCAGYCGDGVVQADCAESCECPMVNGLSVAVCDASTAMPALAPDCARCAGCAVDLSQCATTTTTTTPGGTTTSVPGTAPTTVPGAPTTTTTVPCRTVRCILDAGLHGPACAGKTVPPNITKDLDRVVQLVEEEGGGTPRKARRLVRHAKHALALAEHAVKKDARGKKPKLDALCAAGIERAAGVARGQLGE